MRRKEVIARSPLRILDTAVHGGRGGLGRGNLGLIMAQAGLGKTACLVQIGLDALLRERTVLHVALERTVAQVGSWYDWLWGDLARATGLEDAGGVWEQIAGRRLIATFADAGMSAERLERTVEKFRGGLDFAPHVILVDGYRLGGNAGAARREVMALKACAAKAGSELWLTAQTHGGGAISAVPAPWARVADLVDVVLYLEPEGEGGEGGAAGEGLVAMRVLKDHDNPRPADVRLRLDPDTGRIVPEEATLGRGGGGGGREESRLPPSAYTLLSGGAGGAEACFGECAEKWGLEEINFSFEGREPKRTRGVVELSDVELEQGVVSKLFRDVTLRRELAAGKSLEKVLATIWHQVRGAGEVFSVGSLREDGVVTGGTGWAVELARTWRKPVAVFDQARGSWFRWSAEGEAWQAVEAGEVVVRARRFAGTGTRYLSEAGREAICGVFERSFGNASAALGDYTTR